jgi:hypothetical protein
MGDRRGMPIRNTASLRTTVRMPARRRARAGMAHFDNSPNNPDNAGFFNLVFDVDLPVQEILRKGTVAGVTAR